MTTSQDNALEQALELAAGEPAYRPAFFKLLLTATVYVPGEAGDDCIAGAARDERLSQKGRNFFSTIFHRTDFLFF